jgi:hypothetical protein
VIERWITRPVTGSLPAATHTSHTPGRRSRKEPIPSMQRWIEMRFLTRLPSTAVSGTPGAIAKTRFRWSEARSEGLEPPTF